MSRLIAFWDDESGATVVEYGVLLVILSIMLVGLTSVGSNINVKLSVASSKLQ